jgi:hypothetical protein
MIELGDFAAVANKELRPWRKRPQLCNGCRHQEVVTQVAAPEIS